ncbi:uncharacterized protein LOC111713076 isoform X2 [Eurytemora carolleeae]|uniref:uncharacterized protein LOC111713076 isoform X2 n=1 Tax=Eurytemora carolleeae TaxID=1294199 RepID=UPI000C7917D9|nr:uncharacterized protein LOC111713076 isoform X2 [Eurytemora carolleeae]|eukprot:XP_023343636.1 uncharacterized protein LOC111713076 isoform X2 [Eurytemora affinis]
MVFLKGGGAGVGGGFGGLVVSLLVFMSPAQGQYYCAGTESFDKVTGVELPSASRTPLYSAVGNTVTAECNNRCRASEDCPAFLIDYEEEACYRLDTNTDDNRELIEPTEKRTNYFEKVCLQAPACEKAWIFERAMGYELDGYDDRVVNQVGTRQQCQELCLLETEFQCHSAEYVFKTLECRLSRESRRSQPAAYRATPDDMAYMENQCARERRLGNCEYDEYKNQDIGFADIQTSARNPEECGEQCDQTSAFNCRSYTYFPGTGVCRLSSDDNISAGPQAVTDRAGAQYFQRAPCLDLSLICTDESMTVTLNTEEPFQGRMYAQSKGKDCEVRGLSRTETELTFYFEEESAARCGTLREEKGVYSNVVVIQHHPVIQRKGDRAIQLFCYFETGTKVVTNSYNVLSDVIDNFESSTPSSVVNATAPAPGVRLRITTEDGSDISGTRLGEKLFLRIEMDRESIFGIFARNLKAISGDDQDSIDLLDERGCPTDNVIFPGLQQLPDSRDLQGNFEAFKFSDTSVVRFQVNVQFCVDECNPVDCEDGIQSYGRRRRSANSSQSVPAPTTAVPEPYSSRLVFDPNLGQEVLTVDTPLSKEIIVDSGAKVDSFRTPRFQPEQAPGGVYIKREEGEEEVLCTTLPVVVATAAAVIFLQLCILVTCILCIYTARRGRKTDRQVDRQSLHSGRSSTTPLPPPLHTLYHDNLTYRSPMSTSSRENSASTLKSLRTSLRD